MYFKKLIADLKKTETEKPNQKWIWNNQKKFFKIFEDYSN